MSAAWEIGADTRGELRHGPGDAVSAAPVRAPAVEKLEGRGHRAAEARSVAHPLQAMQESIRALVALEVEAVLRAKGLTRDELTPAGLRIRAGLDQQTLAAKSGVSANSISRLEHGGTREPNAAMTAELAKALGISVRDYRESCARMIERARMGERKC